MKESKWGYRPCSEWTWRNYDGTQKISIEEFVSGKSDDTFFMIGTDSQNYSKKRICMFTTVIIAYKIYKGGSVLIHRDKVPYMPHLRQRLLMEAMRSIETAWYMTLNSLVPDKNVIEIHLDVNSDTNFRSGQYKDELIGLVAAQGYKALIKPDAWAASCTADRKC